MNKHFPGVRTEHIEMTMGDIPARADVIFSPGYGDDPSALNQGYVAIDANAKGREAVNAIFPGAPLAWDSIKGLGPSTRLLAPRGSRARRTCRFTLPNIRTRFPNIL